MSHSRNAAPAWLAPSLGFMCNLNPCPKRRMRPLQSAAHPCMPILGSLVRLCHSLGHRHGALPCVWPAGLRSTPVAVPLPQGTPAWACLEECSGAPHQHVNSIFPSPSTYRTQPPYRCRQGSCTACMQLPTPGVSGSGAFPHGQPRAAVLLARAWGTGRRSHVWHPRGHQ